MQVGFTCAVVITSANSATFIEGEAGSFQATDTDNCGGTIQWSTAGPLPAGVTLDNNTGRLAGTPGPGSAGTWPFTINASDGDNVAAPQSFTLTVSPPLVVTASVFSATEGATFNGKVGGFAGGKAPFTATIAWGDGVTSTGTVVGANVNGIHTYIEEGSKSVMLSVTDAGTTKSSTLAQTVADAGLNSSVEGSQAIAANEGATFNGSVGSFTDQDPFGSASDYTASIAWGDGKTSPGTVTAGIAGQFNVAAAHIYDEHGVLSGTVTITDAGGAVTTNSITATIAEVSPLVVTGSNITATAGVSFTMQVASFNDPGSKEAVADYVVTINWGDGTTSSPSSLVDPPGVILVDGTHAYAAVGTYTITVQAREADVVLFASGTGSASVSALPLTSAPQRPLPLGYLLIVAAGLLLAGGGLLAWGRRATQTA